MGKNTAAAPVETKEVSFPQTTQDTVTPSTEEASKNVEAAQAQEEPLNEGKLRAVDEVTFLFTE